MIGEPNGALCIVEGYATGASIFESTGHAVAIGFNAGNLPPVAKDLRAKFSDLRRHLC
jgi:putative DNA primase/helicase